MRTGPSVNSERAFVPGSRRALRLALPALLALLVLRPPHAAAQDEEGVSRLSFDVFGTLGLVYSSEDQADFVVDPTRPDGPGRSERASLDPDSVFGGQATLRATDKLTAVVQVVTHQRPDDDYDPELEWAYLSYRPTPDLTVRAGRLALPAFMVSEYRKVSYANTWIRPPIELYGMIPVFTVDGIDVSYRVHAGDWTDTFGLNFGQSETDLPRGLGTGAAERSWNLNATFQRGGFTGRFAVAGADLSFDVFDPLFEGFRAFGPAGVAIAERFEIDDTPFRFASGGAEYDSGGWFSMAEIGWLDFQSALGERIGGYVTGGYRLGPVTPYATFSRTERLNDSSHPGLPLAGLPPALAPIAAGLNAALNNLLSGAPEQQSFALGGRWDATTGIALKLQVDFIDLLGESGGTFSNRQPGFEPGGSAQVVSLATVFVF